MRGVLAVLLVTGLLAGCGGDNTAEPSNSVPAENTPSVKKPANQVTVRLSEFKINPANAKGGSKGLVSIKIVNDGNVEHSLAVEGPNGLVELDGSVQPGQSANLEADLDKPGTYTWYCPLDGHRAKGMTGSITVGGDQPARAGEGDTDTITTGTSSTQTQTETQTTTRTETETATVTTPSRTGTETETQSTPTATTGAQAPGN